MLYWAAVLLDPGKESAVYIISISFVRSRRHHASGAAGLLGPRAPEAILAIGLSFSFIYSAINKYNETD